MGPDWKSFIEELIEDIDKNSQTYWYRKELVRYIKNRQIQFLEKALKITDKDEGVPL